MAIDRDPEPGLTLNDNSSNHAPLQDRLATRVPSKGPLHAGSMTDTYTDWKHWEAEQFGQCPRSDSRYFGWCIARANFPTPPNRILEIGFGNGHFLGYCKSQGWSATGIETNASLRDRAHLAGFAILRSMTDLSGEKSFDLIAAFDVLEHVPSDQAEGMLTALRSALSPQGAILLRVPNGDSPFGRPYQHGDRTHVETYGSEKLRQLCASVQLRIIHSGEAPWFAQQGQPRTVKTFLRSLLKRALDRLIGFAYFGYHTDLSPNLFVVVKPIQA